MWTVTAHAGPAQRVAVSIGGSIATASSTGSVAVWTERGELAASFAIAPADGANLAFATDADTLYYEDAFGVIRRFDLDVESLVEVASSTIVRGLSADDCARYFRDRSCPSLGVDR